MRLIIQPDYKSVSKRAANYVTEMIKAANPTAQPTFELDSPTGYSPLGMYKLPNNLNAKGIVSFP